jgi:nucleoid-associated protein Lsr2
MFGARSIGRFGLAADGTAANRSRGRYQARNRAVLDNEDWRSTAPIASPLDPLMERQLPMAKATVQVLIDDLDGSDGAQTVTLGWNGDWREIDLSKRNLASLDRTLDRYWSVGRPVSANGQTTRRGRPTKSSSASAKGKRDPKVIRAWATENRIAVPARGRIPADVERQFNKANGRS